jgi:two-component system NtrC family response regulator
MRSSDQQASEGLLVLSPAMHAVVERLQAFADSDLPIVLVGATGTGKSLLARWVHERSGRGGAFIDCPCGELEPNLARSDLFGHVKGAFTDAVAARVGKVARAGKGTLLLDDFHLLRRSVQYLLLRALAEGRYESVGGEREAALACRIVIGLGEDPDVLVERGRMLADLRYRLGAAVVRIPGLAERGQEIAPLARAFLERYAERRVNGGPRRFTRAAVQVLEAVEWPGNVRQLEFAVWTAYEVARDARADAIDAEHLDELVTAGPRFDPRASPEEKEQVVAWGLRQRGGRVGEAAALIRAGRNTVGRWRRRLTQDGGFRIDPA